MDYLFNIANSKSPDSERITINLGELRSLIAPLQSGIMDVKQAAHYLNKNVDGIRYLVRKHRITPLYIGGKMHFSKEAIDKLIHPDLL